MESARFTGDLHIASRGFSRDYTNGADPYFSDTTTEYRIYRGGSWTNFEEMAPDGYAAAATCSNSVATMTIDYRTGDITGTFSGTKLTGDSAFPRGFQFRCI